MALQQIGLDAVLNNVPDFTGGIDKMNKAVDSFASNSKKHGDSFAGGFGEIVTGALRHIGELAVDALMRAGQAVVGFVKDSIGLAGEFESGMLNFQAVAGQDVDAKGLEEFRDLFLDIGKRLPVSTSEVQAAAIEMVKGGIDPAIIAAGGLERNIQFAAAAMDGDLVKAAEISAKVLGGWTDANATAAEKTDFLANATDLLTKAANASATDVEGLSRGIFQAQGIAKTAGVSFDDLTTTLALLAPRFASSAEAGTSVKNMIARLQPTTDPATAAMEQLGLWTEKTGSAFYDAQGNFVGFETASQLLQTSLQGLTKEQQAAALQTIFGNDAMGAAAALADGGAAAYAAMAESLNNANGVLDTAALKQQGFETSLDNAMGSVEALKITIGSALLPMLGTLLDDYIAPGVNALTDLASAVFGDEEAFKKLSPAMQDVATGIQDFADAVAEGIKIAQDIGGEIQALIDDFNQAGGASESLSSAVDDLNGVWEKALDVIGNVMDGYKAIIDAVLPIIAGFIAEHGDEIESFFKSTWDTIIEIVTLALELYDAIVPPILQAIAGFIEDHGSEITKILSGAWDMITSLITGALDTIKGVIKLAVDLIHGDWEAAWNDIKGIVDAQATAIGGIVTGFLNLIAGIFDTTLDDILQTWEDNWNMAVNIVSNIDWAEVGQSAVDGIMQGLRSAWGSLTSWLTDAASSLVDAALDAIGAGSPAVEFMPVGQFAVQGMMQGFSDTWPQLTDLVGTLSEDLIGQMEDIGSQIQNAVADSFGATASIDRQIAKNLDRFKDVLPQYAAYTQGALKQVQQEAEAFADPAEGAKWFKMRSDQILEYAKLQKQLSEATRQEDKDRISQQMLLINRAQSAEIAQFQATAQAQSPMMDIAAQINEILRTIAGINLTDEQIHIVDMLATMLGQLQSPVNTRQQQYANPPSSTTNTTNLNMPIYTNNSPAALQQSMAIAGAALL